MNKFQPKGMLKVISGSVLTPYNSGLGLILNFCDVGRGSGIDSSPLLPVFDKKWVKVRANTKELFALRAPDYKLGNISSLVVQSDAWIVQLLCKNDKGKLDNTALTECLKKVAKMAKYEKASVHVSSLLLKDAKKLHKLLESELINNGINVFIYTAD